jgi:hypothetical protein
MLPYCNIHVCQPNSKCFGKTLKFNDFFGSNNTFSN